MPTREEIAAWLRESAELFDGLSDMISPKSLQALKIRSLKRADQVDAMRCETCELYDPVTEYATDCCLHPLISISNQGQNFGCFHHEPKEQR